MMPLRRYPHTDGYMRGFPGHNLSKPARREQRKRTLWALYLTYMDAEPKELNRPAAHREDSMVNGDDGAKDVDGEHLPCVKWRCRYRSSVLQMQMQFQTEMEVEMQTDHLRSHLS